MGQVLDFCQSCENKRGCDLCMYLHEWIMEHLSLEAEYKGLKWRHARAMEKLQGTDFVNVVRCKNCLRAKDALEVVGRPGLYQCGNSGICHPADHFCANGRPKSEKVTADG